MINERMGIDYSIWRPPSVQWLRDNGYSFVCRYLSWLPNLKVIDRAEYNELREGGIDVVLVWEYGATDMLGGADTGYLQAAEARRQAMTLGAWPCPIFFACDFDAAPADQPAIDDYLRACANVLTGFGLVGMYGGYWPLSRARGAGLCHYAWQTSAWSGTNRLATAYLLQLPEGTADYDVDVALALDFGQVSSALPPPPPPPPHVWGSDEGREAGWPLLG